MHSVQYVVSPLLEYELVYDHLNKVKDKDNHIIVQELFQAGVVGTFWNRRNISAELGILTFM